VAAALEMGPVMPDPAMETWAACTAWAWAAASAAVAGQGYDCDCGWDSGLGSLCGLGDKENSWAMAHVGSLGSLACQISVEFGGSLDRKFKTRL